MSLQHVASVWPGLKNERKNRQTKAEELAIRAIRRDDQTNLTQLSTYGHSRKRTALLAAAASVSPRRRSFVTAVTVSADGSSDDGSRLTTNDLKVVFSDDYNDHKKQNKTKTQQQTYTMSGKLSVVVICSGWPHFPKLVVLISRDFNPFTPKLKNYILPTLEFDR